MAGPQDLSAADYYSWNCLSEQAVLTSNDGDNSGNPLFTLAVTHKRHSEKPKVSW